MTLLTLLDIARWDYNARRRALPKRLVPGRGPAPLLVRPVHYSLPGLGVLPGVGSLVFTGQAPTVGLSLLPGVGSTVFTGLAPAVGLSLLPSAGSAVFTGQAPTVGLSLLPGVGSAIFTGFAPTVGLSLLDYYYTYGRRRFPGHGPRPLIPTPVPGFPPSAFPGVGSIVFTGVAPSLSLTVLPSVGSAVLTGLAPSVSQSVAPGAGSAVFTGAAPNVGQALLPGVGSSLFTGFAPLVALSLLPGVGSAIFSGAAPTVTAAAGVTVDFYYTYGRRRFPGHGPRPLIPTTVPGFLVTPLGTPAAGALTFTGFAPTASQTAPDYYYTYGRRRVPGRGPWPLIPTTVPGFLVTPLGTPAAGALTFTGFAPTASQTAPDYYYTYGRRRVPGRGPWPLIPTTVPGFRPPPGASPGVGSVVFSGFAPTVSGGATVAPGVGSLVFTGFAPRANQSLLPSVGSIVLTGVAPRPDESLLPGAGAAVFTGFAPTVGGSAAVAPGPGALALTGQAPLVNQAIFPGAGALSFAGQAPTLTAGTTINPAAGSILFGGLAPEVIATGILSLAPDAGLITVTGYAPILGGAHVSWTVYQAGAAGPWAGPAELPAGTWTTNQPGKPGVWTMPPAAPATPWYRR